MLSASSVLSTGLVLGAWKVPNKKQLKWFNIFLLCCCYSLPSHVQLFVTPWTAACQAYLSFTISWSLLKLMSIKSMMPSNHLILCHPFLLLPSIFPNIRVFSNESALHMRSPNYWSFSHSPSNENSGLISFFSFTILHISLNVSNFSLSFPPVIFWLWLYSKQILRHKIEKLIWFFT